MGGGFKITQRGSFSKLENFLHKVSGNDIYASLEGYAQRGVDALSAATPRDSGVTAGSWNYYIDQTGGQTSITWTNESFDEQGTPIVILLQYGHGTGTGGYVRGYDFINPTMKSVFDDISDGVWKAVVAA